MSEERESQAAETTPAAGAAPSPLSDNAPQNFMMLRRRLALLTGLVVANTAMLIVLLILAR